MWCIRSAELALEAREEAADGRAWVAGSLSLSEDDERRGIRESDSAAGGPSVPRGRSAAYASFVAGSRNATGTPPR